jgi:AbrB family looped-hinge helix DNA binding protein
MAAKSRIDSGGRVVLPAAFRRRLGLEPGDAIVMELRGDEVRLRSSSLALRRLQDRLASRERTGGTLVSEELLADRRSERSAALPAGAVRRRSRSPKA